MCKLFRWTVGRTPLHSYSHGRSISSSNFSLGRQIPSPLVYHMAISSCCILKQQRSLLFRVWAHNSSLATTFQCSLDIWETHTSLTHHTSLTYSNITRHHMASVPFLHFCHLCSTFLSDQVSSNTGNEMLVSFSCRHPQILQVVFLVEPSLDFGGWALTFLPPSVRKSFSTLIRP